MALPRVRVLLLKPVECDGQPAFAAGTSWIVLCASEGDCTSEMGLGQFSIFGAIEEKIGRRFSQRNAD